MSYDFYKNNHISQNLLKIFLLLKVNN